MRAATQQQNIADSTDANQEIIKETSPQITDITTTEKQTTETVQTTETTDRILSNITKTTDLPITDKSPVTENTSPVSSPKTRSVQRVVETAQNVDLNIQTKTASATKANTIETNPANVASLPTVKTTAKNPVILPSGMAGLLAEKPVDYAAIAPPAILLEATKKSDDTKKQIDQSVFGWIECGAGIFFCWRNWRGQKRVTI